MDSTSPALAFLGAGPDWLKQMYMLMHAQFPDAPLPPHLAPPPPPPRRITETRPHPAGGEYTITHMAC